MTRREQIGSGSRHDAKIKTYREKDNVVANHLTGQKSRLTDVLKGKI